MVQHLKTARELYHVVPPCALSVFRMTTNRRKLPLFRVWRWTPWGLLRPMNDSQNINLVWLEVIDYPVWTFNYLANLRKGSFRDHSAGKRECSNLFRAKSQAIHGSLGICDGITGDECVDGCEMGDCGICPMYIHAGNPKRLRTSFTSMVLPAWLSARPDSMAWRT